MAESLSPTSSATRLTTLRLPATCDPPSESNPPKTAVWIVFGATGHIGRSLIRACLSRGDKVTAVGWTQEDSKEQMHTLEKMSGEGNCLGMLCDVRVRCTVDRVIKMSAERWGRIDIICNCTGYGVIAPCEDQDESDLRNQFETNVYGTINVLQLSLPVFRAQNHGRYLIFSSTAGALGVPGLGPYCATKYAVEGLIESMLYEIDAFNIKATLVEPGHVRLDEGDGFAIVDKTSQQQQQQQQQHGQAQRPNSSDKPHHLKRYGHFFVKPASDPYNSASAPAGHAKRMVRWLNDRQPTSPFKSAELVWQLGHCSYPPLRLLLGTYAVESIRDRLRSIIEEIEDWKHLSFPAQEGDDDAGGGDKEGREGADGMTGARDGIQEEYEDDEEMKEAE